MRRWFSIGTMVLMGARSAPLSHTYRVDVEEVSVIDDGTAPIVDTTVVSAILSLTVADTLGARMAKVVVDSLWFRHSTGAERSTVAQLEPKAAGMTYRAVVSVGHSDSAVSFTYDVDPPIRLIEPLSTSLRYLFPGIRPSAKAGDHWSDSTTSNGATVVTEWTILGERDGVFDARVVQKVGSSATSPDGERVSSEGTITRDIRSTIAGPVLSGIIRKQTSGSGSSAVESLHLTFSKSTVTRIVQLK